MSQTLLQRFVNTYQRLDKDALDSLRPLYSDDVEFVDNLHRLRGVDALLDYFQSQYQHLHCCRFYIHEAHQSGDNAWLTWDMEYRHPRVNGGRAVRVPGASHLRLAQSVHYHRDYFDMGASLYEHLPLLGRAIRWVKSRATA